MTCPSEEASPTVGRLLGSGAAYLSRHGVEAHEARTQAEILVSEAMGLSGPGLALARDRVPGEATLERLRGMFRRVAAGEPVQYVVGHWPFHDIELKVDARALIPRPETEELVERVLRSPQWPGAQSIADIGTGTGAIVLALAKASAKRGMEGWRDGGMAHAGGALPRSPAGGGAPCTPFGGMKAWRRGGVEAGSPREASVASRNSAAVDQALPASHPVPLRFASEPQGFSLPQIKPFLHVQEPVFNPSSPPNGVAGHRPAPPNFQTSKPPNFHSSLHFTAVDLSPEALSLARENAEALGLGGHVRFVLGNGCSALAPDSMDIIVSNPPYIAAGEVDALPSLIRAYEPRMALDGGPDGLDILRQIVLDATQALRPGGRLFLEIGDDQGLALRRLLDRAGYTDVVIAKDFAGHDRYAEGTLR